MDQLIANFDEQTVRDNIELMKSKNINLDIFIHRVSMLYDQELRRKVELLLSIGKETLDLYLNPSVLTKYTSNQLERVISVIAANGLDPKEVPLIAY